MIYLLDTNPCIRYLNAKSDTVRRRIESAGDEQLVVCSVVKAELFFGAVKSISPEETSASQRQFLSRFVSLPFDDDAAETYAGIRADLESQGLPIGSNDLMIAAIALANNLTLVTHNTAEFERVKGLRIEDWEL